MAGYLGYCHRCRALSEFFDRRVCMRWAHDNYPSSQCGARVRLLWSTHEIAQAVLAAYKIGGWDAAVAVWDEAGRPELAYES